MPRRPPPRAARGAAARCPATVYPWGNPLSASLFEGPKQETHRADEAAQGEDQGEQRRGVQIVIEEVADQEAADDRPGDLEAERHVAAAVDDSFAVEIHGLNA